MSGKVKALYGGSFDPIHFGHLDIVKRAAKMFDLTVVVANNPTKKHVLPSKSRRILIERAVKNIPNVSVTELPEGMLLADFASEQMFPVLVRGVRNFSDYDMEKMMRDINFNVQTGVETVFLSCSPSLSHISSGAVNSLMKHGGFIHEYVPLAVKQELEYWNGKEIIGITGSIGCGKNWVADKIGELLKHDRQVVNIDLDSISHHILTSSTPSHRAAIEIIEGEFGVFTDANGYLTSMGRKQLGNRVFGDPVALALLNEIMEVPFMTELRRRLKDAKGLVLLNSALLVEFGLTHICNNNVILVDSPEGERKRRLKGRGLTEEQITRRTKSQLDNSSKWNKMGEIIKRDGCGHREPYANYTDRKEESVHKELLRIINLMTRGVK